MAMNSRQRSRWISEIIAELQRYASKNRSEGEISQVQQALVKLGEAREKIDSEKAGS
jgi:hypothetical protein